jgi:hypothetical protein
MIHLYVNDAELGEWQQKLRRVEPQVLEQLFQLLQD